MPVEVVRQGVWFRRWDEPDSARHELLAERLERVRRTRDAHEVAEFVSAYWELHAYFAELGKGVLLNTLYLSIMDLGTGYLRAKLADIDLAAVRLDPLAEAMEDLVDALERHDAPAAVAALHRTVPTVILPGGE
ncbi:FCD domain-containing protein [Amycolatopsis nivea]